MHVVMDQHEAPSQHLPGRTQKIT